MSEPFVRMRNAIQSYAWGSRTAMSAFLGRPNPAGRPEAELWLGAHPKSPSFVESREGVAPLADWIAKDPSARLGDETAARFGGQLPYLLKVLAVAEPLSIQAHPNLAQARDGFARENAALLPLDSPRRNYRDALHKPELVVALTRFAALSGFRPVDEIVGALSPGAGSIVGRELERLGADRTSDALRDLFDVLMRLDRARRQELIERAASRAPDRHALPLALEWVAKLRGRYPDDVGALGPLFLNLVVLDPEEALFLEAGEPHAYLDGMAVEIMASSDNVLRGGLTPKHIDVPELVRTLTFRTGRPVVHHPEVASPTESVYRTPAAEFELGLLRVEPSTSHVSAVARGPEIVLCLDGEATLSAAGHEALLRRGEAVLVPASAPAYSIAGRARLCRAGVPHEAPGDRAHAGSRLQRSRVAREAG
jgi:mannose-6-phosphate isomerase